MQVKKYVYIPAIVIIISLPWIIPDSTKLLLNFWQFAVAVVATGLLIGFYLKSMGAGTISYGFLCAGVISVAMAFIQYFGYSAIFSSFISVASQGEAFANLRQRNQFASLTNIALAAMLWFAVLKANSRRAVLLLVLTSVLLAMGNAASSSRTGLMQLLLLCCLVGVWGGFKIRRIRLVLLVVVASYFAAVFLLPLLAGLDPSTQGALARLRAGDAVCASRLTLWSNVLHLIAQKPWFGWGWGELDYAHYITLYNGPRFCDILDNAHNLPLHLAVELGSPVALLACGLFAWWIARQKPWRETDPTRQMAWAVLAVILLHSMLEYPLWYGPFQMATGLCLWMLWRPSPAVAARDSTDAFETVAERTADRAIFPWHRIRIAVAVSMLVGCAYAAWDYWRISQVYLPPSARDAAYRDNTLEKIRGSWLFSNQVSFAELGMTGLTPANAQWTHDTATRMLHFSPEPRVIEKVIESATMLGRDDEALAHLARYRAAFPADYAKWALANKLPAPKT